MCSFGDARIINQPDFVFFDRAARIMIGLIVVVRVAQCRIALQ